MQKNRNNQSQNSFALRRSAQPYTGLPVILCCVLIGMVVVAVKINDWGGIKIAVPGFIFFVAINVWFGMRYRIFLNDVEIIQKAVAGNLTKIKIDEITDIVQETSDLQTLATFSRPMRRIVIYAKHTDGGKFIDVSLKHFMTADIRKLMGAIHQRRPDLTLPKQWL